MRSTQNDHNAQNSLFGDKVRSIKDTFSTIETHTPRRGGLKLTTSVRKYKTLQLYLLSIRTDLVSIGFFERIQAVAIRDPVQLTTNHRFPQHVVVVVRLKKRVADCANSIITHFARANICLSSGERSLLRKTPPHRLSFRRMFACRPRLKSHCDHWFVRSFSLSRRMVAIKCPPHTPHVVMRTRRKINLDVTIRVHYDWRPN